MKQRWRFMLLGLLMAGWLTACSASRHSESGILSAMPGALPAMVEDLRAELRADPEEPELYFLLATALLRMGRADEAERNALQAIRRWPFDGSVMNLLGDIYLAQNKRFRALTSYSEAVALDPSLLAAYVNLGKVRHLLGQEQQAETTLLEAVRREPTYYPAQIALSRLLFDVGNLEAAAQAVAAARQIRPAAPEAILLEIRINKSQGHLTVAAYLVAQALKGKAAAAGLKALKAELLDIHVQRKNWDKAKVLLEEMAGQGGLTTDDLLVKTIILRGMGQHRQANRLLRKLLRREPEHPGVVLAGARASIERGNPADALEPLNGAVERNPKFADAYYWKAVAHYQLDQPILGNAALDIATTLAPYHPPVRLLRVRRLLAERKIAEALPLLNAHLSAYPADGNALLVRSELHTLLGNYQAAERDLAGVLPSSNDTALRFARARLAYLRGQFRTVLDDTGEPAKRASTPWQLVYLHASALLHLGNGAEALPLLGARIRKGQGGGELHRLVGDIYHLAGALGKASKSYRAGLEKFPRNTRLLEALARLAMEARNWGQARKWLETRLERPGGLKYQVLEKLRLVYLRLKQPEKAQALLRRYLKEADPLAREGDSLGEQAILFNTAMPAIGYSARPGYIPAIQPGSAAAIQPGSAAATQPGSAAASRFGSAGGSSPNPVSPRR